MASPWRLHARNVIQAAIRTCQSSDPKVIRKAIRDAYPYGLRANHPYQIWCSEVKSALADLGIDKRKLGPVNLGNYNCKWCKDTGCLICKANGHQRT